MTVAPPERRFVDSELMTLLPDAVFAWYALQVVGGQENSAAAHLAGRRFGVYLPVEVATEVVRGRKVTRACPLFPGYLFVATPAIKTHWRQIVGTPGAIEILGDGPAPREITSEEIHRIRVAENTEFAVDIRETEYAYSGRKRRRRRSRRARIGRAIDRQRQISVLAKELGLAPSSPSGFLSAGGGLRVAPKPENIPNSSRI